jgi:hypothetical protein
MGSCTTINEQDALIERCKKDAESKKKATKAAKERDARMKRKRDEEAKEDKIRRKEEASKAKARDRQIRQNESRKRKRADANAEKENFVSAQSCRHPANSLLLRCMLNCISICARQ